MEALLRHVNPHGPLPPVASTKTGSLLVIGTAGCVWDDLQRYDGQHQGDRMALSDMIAYYPGVLQHGSSLHTDGISMFAFRRVEYDVPRGLPAPLNHSHRAGEAVDCVWPLTRDGGTTGLFSVLIGLLMGYEKVILAGSPLDGKSHFYDPPWSLGNYDSDAIHDEWKRTIPVMQGRVKSLSGITREWFGEPS